MQIYGCLVTTSGMICSVQVASDALAETGRSMGIVAGQGAWL